MMYNPLKFFFQSTVLASLLFLIGCDGPGCREVPDIGDVSVSITYEPLEGEMSGLASVDEAIRFLRRNKMLTDEFLHARQYPNDTILARRLFRLMDAPSIDSLFMATQKKFGDMQTIVAQFEDAYKLIRHYYPHARVPKIQSVVTGFYNDLYISDTLVIIGLDYFLGKDSQYRPNDIPAYLVKRYEEETVTPIVLSFLANDFNRTDQRHKDLLADMVNLGKSYYFVSQVLPCAADSLIVGYSAEEMKVARENQEIIWANLIQNEMLYETSHFLKNKFVGERPNVPEISEQCPGRIGAWLGWEIVKAYMESNGDVTLVELMAETDAHKIFQQSKYRPKNAG